MKFFLRFNNLFIFFFIVLLSSCKTNYNIVSKLPIEKKTESAFYSRYSEKLGVKLTGTEDKKLLSYIAEWLGAPYKYGGSTIHGTDCSGMVLAVYRDVYSISLFRSSADQIKNVVPIEKNKLKAGDLVFFKINGDKVSHVGIYIAEDKFIHSSTKRGVVINSLNDEYYKKYFFTGGRVIKNPIK
ncbi:MAG: NlpC/P60 family protein [Bacteroidales bacterium]|nr:NlpC/P60 family protein [Bacteroidales bacterium]MDD4215005.1 NlpC/P60 family protein [Bacteroidales bacterium]